MELQIVRGGEFRAACLGGSAGVHGDVLEGRDWCVEWEDVFVGDDLVEKVGVLEEMEGRVRMNL